MLQNLLAYYENQGAYYVALCLVVIAIMLPLWYGVSRAVRIALLFKMGHIHQRLQEYVENNPAKYKHYETGIDRLVKKTRDYKEFQQSLNLPIIFEIMSSKPSNSEIVKSLRNCKNEKELRDIMLDMSAVFLVTMIVATPWIPILVLLSLAALLLVTLLAVITRNSIKALDWLKSVVAVKALTFDFEHSRISTRPLMAL